VLEAVAALGASVQQVGEHGSPTLLPEREIAEADLVIGYGRSALAGLACGRPTFVHDHRGADGWVTGETYPRFEADGFAGLATDGDLAPAALRRAFMAYDPALGATGRKLVLVHHNAFKHAAELSGVLKDLTPRPQLDDDAAGELARLSRLQWESEWRSNVLQEEVSDLGERLRRAEDAASKSDRRAAALADELRLLKQTRRYRLAPCWPARWTCCARGAVRAARRSAAPRD
jgi:hypothetical protein